MKPKRRSIFIEKKPPAAGKKIETAWQSAVTGWKSVGEVLQPIETEWRSSFFSCLVDMYSHPDMMELRFPPHGKQQRLHNAKRIRSYFAKSLGEF